MARLIMNKADAEKAVERIHNETSLQASVDQVDAKNFSVVCNPANWSRMFVLQDWSEIEPYRVATAEPANDVQQSLF